MLSEPWRAWFRSMLIEDESSGKNGYDARAVNRVVDRNVALQQQRDG